jgi:hypothetical protein
LSPLRADDPVLDIAVPEATGSAAVASVAMKEFPLVTKQKSSRLACRVGRKREACAVTVAVAV